MLGCIILTIGAAIQTTSFGIPQVSDQHSFLSLRGLLLILGSRSPSQLIVGRIVTGLGNGMNTSTVPVWHSECTLPKNRGRALAIELAICIFGVVSPSSSSTLGSPLALLTNILI